MQRYLHSISLLFISNILRPRKVPRHIKPKMSGDTISRQITPSPRKTELRRIANKLFKNEKEYNPMTFFPLFEDSANSMNI